MSTKIFCRKLEQQGESLERSPYPGPLGKRIQAEICLEAWKAWLLHQTMLINENRLNPLDPDARLFLEQEMEKYFFGEGSEKPKGYNSHSRDDKA
jgi:Fe-S cluster biosynthesis and repair protein YggX